ncbi:MAG TPA: acyl-CoA dehydrogenase family protein [Acidimicrobiales bacterium]|jgi:hypothetical protein|nr:acyl-CoA dehydrogenase family protein [Acidimicrobiales bacterium]
MISDAEVELFDQSIRAAAEQHRGADLDPALADLGWDDALADDPHLAVSRLFEVQGAVNATSSALDRVLSRALALPAADRDGASAAAATVVVLPTLGSSQPPGTLTDGRLSVTSALTTTAPSSRDRALVVARTTEHDVAVVVPTAALTSVGVSGLDPSLGLCSVSAAGLEVGAVTDVATWENAVAAARVAIGHELVGLSRTMLEMARTHALERIQFGRPIAGFQAVRHRLAEALVAIEMADAVLDAAWLDGSPTTAAMAKALAGRSARTVARHSQQVLAGIGFTTEHPFHRYMRRALVLDELFGSARALTRQLGDDLIATRRLPAQLPL